MLLFVVRLQFPLVVFAHELFRIGERGIDGGYPVFRARLDSPPFEFVRNLPGVLRLPNFPQPANRGVRDAQPFVFPRGRGARPAMAPCVSTDRSPSLLMRVNSGMSVQCKGAAETTRTGNVISFRRTVLRTTQQPDANVQPNPSSLPTGTADAEGDGVYA
jgi:hypothetical protein